MTEDAADPRDDGGRTFRKPDADRETDHRETLREKLDDPYRVRCPEGHAQITERVVSKTTPTVYCEECGAAYRFEELVDMRALSNPGEAFE
ncbi:MAG: hypothetical protein ABEJ40_00125 [Haloarculaceae archaeon]